MKENDIRPKEMLEKYFQLCQEDAAKCFSSKDRREINCPACDSTSSTYVFTKSGFEYQECQHCHSIFQSPRPKRAEYESFYRDSASVNYWTKVFFPAVLEARREKIFTPRAKKISTLCQEASFLPESILDIGGGSGIFLEEWRKLYSKASLYVVEPNELSAKSCQDKGIETFVGFVEDADAWENIAELLTCFEVIEHAYDPILFIQSLYQLVKPGGYALVTGLGADGFDIQLLWEKSRSVTPPHHINFLSIHGFEVLFKRAGFKDVKILTPGELDVDIVLNMLSDHNDILLSHFEKTLLRRDKDALDNFQRFLAENQLSSHCWVWAQK